MYKIICLVVLGVIGSITLSSGYGLKRYPSNLMLDYNWPEPDEHIKKFPHERFCHYYYQRETDELFTIRKCPHREMFDYHIHECREKHSAQCWSHRYGKHAVHDHIHSKWRKHFKCPFPNGNYPDIFDCDKYIVCLDGKPHHKHCSPNQQFDKYRRHCVYVGVCANSTDAALMTHMCPYSSGKFAHFEDCSKYYNCHKSEPTVKTCEENKLFDEDDSECKNKELVHCKDRPNPYVLGKTSPTKSTVESETTNVSHPSISSANIGTKAADMQTVESNKPSVATANFVQSISTEIIDETGTKYKASVESITHSAATENLHSLMPLASTDQTVEQSDASSNSPSSMFSVNTTKPTLQSVAAIDNSHSSVFSSNTVKSTAKPETTDNSHSSQSSTINKVQSTVTASATSTPLNASSIP